MTRRFSRSPLFFLPLAATLASSWASAATPRDAGTPLPADPEPTQVVAQAGAIASPGLGVAVALDARVVAGLYLGAQGGFFTDQHVGYPFVGARASYRIEVTDAIRIVPTLGVAHLSVGLMDTDVFTITHETPVSITAGLQLAAQVGHFLVGCDFQVMPVHYTRETRSNHEASEETRYPTPVAVFVGSTF